MSGIDDDDGRDNFTPKGTRRGQMNGATSPRGMLPGLEVDGNVTDNPIDDDALDDFDIPDPTKRDKRPKQKQEPLYKRVWWTFVDTLGQGDLAGFQIIWCFVSIVFLILKLLQVSIFDNVEMWTIFVLPLLNTILTGIFDYLIGTYRDEKHVESLIRPRFMAVFAFKVVVALFVFGSWLFSTDKGFIDRYSNPDYVVETIDGTTTLVPEDSGSKGKWHDGYCVCQVWTVFAACFLALCITELIITTNIVNSESNLKINTPTKIRIILLIIRPFVWVYNRAMIMFISFYIFYFTIYIVFAVGIMCDIKCEFERCSTDLQIVGAQFLLIPFSKPYYLGVFNEAWQPLSTIKNDDLTETITLTFLVTSYWVDQLNGIYVACRRFILAPLFPEHCALAKPEIHKHDNDHRQHTMTLSHNISQQTSFGRDDTDHEESRNSLRSGSGGLSTPRSGNSSNNVLAGSMILKSDTTDYATSYNQSFGEVTRKIEKAKSRRILSQHPLNDVATLLENKSLGTIVDDEDEEQFGITPAHSTIGDPSPQRTKSTHSNPGSNGGSGNGIALVTLNGNGNDKLGTQFLYGNLSKQDSVSDDRGSRTSQKSKSQSKTDVIDRYRKSRASVKNRQKVQSKSIAGGTASPPRGYGSVSPHKARSPRKNKSQQHHTHHTHHTHDQEREESIETSDEYHASSPGPHQSTSVRAGAIAGAMMSNNNNNNTNNDNDDDSDMDQRTVSRPVSNGSNGAGAGAGNSNSRQNHRRKKKSKQSKEKQQLSFQNHVSVGTDTPGSDTGVNGHDSFVTIEPDYSDRDHDHDHDRDGNKTNRAPHHQPSRHKAKYKNRPNTGNYNRHDRKKSLKDTNIDQDDIDVFDTIQFIDDIDHDDDDGRHKSKRKGKGKKKSKNQSSRYYE